MLAQLVGHKIWTCDQELQGLTPGGLEARLRSRIVWRGVRGKIIRSVLYSIVCYNVHSAFYEHTYEQT